MVSMGPGVLRSLLAMNLDPGVGVGFVCLAGGEITGYICGTANVRHYYLRYVARFWPTLIVVGIRTISDRAMLQRLLARRHYLTRIMRLNRRANYVRAESASLVFIAVDPARRGLGDGKLLVERFEAALQDQGVRQVSLTVHDENVAARALYERLGWKPVERRSNPDGVPSWLYLKRLDPHARIESESGI